MNAECASQNASKLAIQAIAGYSTYDGRMTTFFISRHPGAIEWAARQQLGVDRQLSHLDPAQVQPGDTVIGSLPVNLAAQVCAAGASYWHLSLELPVELRGCELSSDDLERIGARVERFEVCMFPLSKKLKLIHGNF